MRHLISARRSHRCAATALFGALATLSPVSHAVDGAELAWTQLGPPSADVLDLAVSPHDPATVLAAAAGGGAFVSIDAGSTWELRSQVAEAPDASAVHVDHLVPGRWFAGSSAGRVHRTTDAGGSWIEEQGLEAIEGRAVRAFAQQPGSGLLLLATAGSGVFRRAGGSWSAASSGLGSSFVETVAFDPLASNIAWASTATAGLFRSVDGGSTWAARNSGLGSSFVTALAHHPTVAGQLWVGTSAGAVFSTLDDGASWQNTSAGLPSAPVLDLTATATHLLAATGHGVYRRALGGTTWDPVADALPVPTRRVVESALGLVAGTAGAGVYGLDAGETLWQPRNQGLVSSFALAAHSVGATGDLLVGTSGGGVWRWSDGQWSASSAGLSSSFVATFAEDNGTGDLFAGTTGGSVARSENGGASWVPADQGLELAFVRRLRQSTSSDLLAATSGGMFRSLDGASWTSSGLAALDVRSLVAVTGEPLGWRAGDGAGTVHGSDDDGESWSPIATLGGGSAARALAYTADHRLVAGNDAGVWLADSGSSFVSCGLTDERVSALAQLDGVLYAATLDSGVWTRSDGCSGAATWRRLQAGMPQTGIYGLDIIDWGSPPQSRLAASTFGGGVFLLLPAVPLFADGFESGGLDAWTRSVP